MSFISVQASNVFFHPFIIFQKKILENASKTVSTMFHTYVYVFSRLSNKQTWFVLIGCSNLLQQYPARLMHICILLSWLPYFLRREMNSICPILGRRSCSYLAICALWCETQRRNAWAYQIPGALVLQCSHNADSVASCYLKATLLRIIFVQRPRKSRKNEQMKLTTD